MKSQDESEGEKVKPAKNLGPLRCLSHSLACVNRTSCVSFQPKDEQ